MDTMIIAAITAANGYAGRRNGTPAVADRDADGRRYAAPFRLRVRRSV